MMNRPQQGVFAVSFGKLLVRDAASRARWHASPAYRDELVALCWQDGLTRDAFGSRAAVAAYLQSVADGRASSVEQFEREAYQIQQSTLRRR